MDASNRSHDDEVEEVDERNLAIVFGEVTLPVTDLNSAERIALVKRLIKRARPHLIYMPEGKAVSEWITEPRIAQSYNFRRTAQGCVALAPIIEFKTRMARLVFVGGKYTNPDPSIGQIRGIRTEEQLMLTRDGDLVMWTASYESYSEPGHGRRHHRTAYIEEAISSVFAIPTDADLLTLLEDDNSCLEIVTQLYQWSVVANQRRLKALRDGWSLEHELAQIVGRIGEV